MTDLSHVTVEEIKAVLSEALAVDIEPQYVPYVIASASGLRDGSKGNVKWSLHLIKMLALSIVESRRE